MHPQLKENYAGVKTARLWSSVFLSFLAKIRFVKRLLTAKADINIFNQSLAICLVASGKFVAKNLDSLVLAFMGWHKQMV